MPRIIKFKAWDIKEKTWIADGNDMDLHYSAKVGVFMFDNDHYDLARKELEFVQWTGLKDKSGKEIFEGDILGGIYEPSTIEWCDVCKSFQLHIHNIIGYGPCKQCEGDVSWSEIVQAEDLVVIGNKYENPELLK